MRQPRLSQLDSEWCPRAPRPAHPAAGWEFARRRTSAARTTAARWRLLLTQCSAAGAPHQELPAEGPSPQTVGWDPEAGAKAVDARCPTSQIRLAAGWRVAGGGRRAGHQFRWVGQCPCRWGACASGHSQLEPLLLFGAACGGWAVMFFELSTFQGSSAHAVSLLTHVRARIRLHNPELCCSELCCSAVYRTRA